jgi:hypothetical protein
VSGNLDCQGNGTITGTGNLVQGTVRGQCTGSRP